MTYSVLVGTLNRTHSLTQSITHSLTHLPVGVKYFQPVFSVKYMYTVSQIKTPMRTIVHNFVKFLPIFTIF